MLIPQVEKEEYFSNPDEVQRAYETENLEVHSPIKVRIEHAEMVKLH